MLLRYFVDAQGRRVYTTDERAPAGQPTLNAHPARFSPDDRSSAERLALKKRFQLLPTQRPAEPL